MSLGLAACGGDATTVVPTAVPTTVAVATDTTAPVAATATLAPVAPTDTVMVVAPTATTAPAAPTDTALPAAPTDTALPAAPTATTAAVTGGNGGPMATGNAGLLQQATAGMRDLKSYRMDITSEASGQKSQTTVDIDVANKAFKITSAVAGYSSISIVIGDKAWGSADGGKTYVANPGGAALAQSMSGYVNMWQAASTSGTATTDPNIGIKAGSPATEQIDGTDTTHLVVDNSAFGGTTVGSTDMWITTGTNPTIRQITSTVTVAGVTGHSTIKWSKFNEDLGIKDPTK